MFRNSPKLFELPEEYSERAEKLLRRWSVEDEGRKAALEALTEWNARWLEARRQFRAHLAIFLVMAVVGCVFFVQTGALPDRGLLFMCFLAFCDSLLYWYKHRRVTTKYSHVLALHAEEMVFFELTTQDERVQLPYWLELREASDSVAMEMEQIEAVVEDRERRIGVIYYSSRLLFMLMMPAPIYLAWNQGGLRSGAIFIGSLIGLLIVGAIMDRVVRKWCRNNLLTGLVPQITAMCTESAGTWELAKVWYGLDGEEKASAVEEDGEASLPEQATPS